MDVLDTFVSAPIIYGIATLSIVLFAHIYSYIRDHYRLRDVPGPFLAKFSDAWLALAAGSGHRSEIVHAAHTKYGVFVRIAPNHTSIASPEALHVVYGHGNGVLKTDFYDAFASSIIGHTLFDMRDRVDHARKRKIASHAFSPHSVLDFEPSIRKYVEKFVGQWDRLCNLATKNMSGTEGKGGWKGRDGRLWLDCLPWWNYLSTDIIGDLLIGDGFGMVSSASDTTPVVISHEDAMASYGVKEVALSSTPAIEIFVTRGEVAATLGVIPPWIRPLLWKLPWFNSGKVAIQNLSGMVIAAIVRRLAPGSDGGRVDLLTRLQEGRDENGNLLTREEVTAEASSQLTPGSETTSNTSCATTYYLARNLRAQRKLQNELDEALGTEENTSASYNVIKGLPYLQAVINETLRLHSTASLGLPRIVPRGGLTVLGKTFPQGAIVSVPTYSIHRDPEVWGDDVEEFRPERWFEKDHTAMKRAFNPFSYGPRACLGRNLAMMKMQIMVASVFHRFDFVLEEPEKHFNTREGFLRKPYECKVGIKSRIKY